MNEQITLYYRQGTSDKIYHISLEEKGDGFVINFAYGRRGSTMSTGTKTPSPVRYPEANAIYDKLVKEKTAKGYTAGEAGTPYQHTDKERQRTGIHCQLLNAVEEHEASNLITDAGWCMQEKHDGKRLLIHKDDDGEIIGINRKGLIVSLPSPIAEEASRLESTFIIDGECVGDQFIAFDVLEIGNQNAREWSYKKRLFALGQLLTGMKLRYVSKVHSVAETQEKLVLLEQLKHRGKEGVVFKKLSSPYTTGRPASGGNQLKLKFVESASFIVGKVNMKRSVSLLLFNGDRIVEAGNVTIPPNHDIPQSGQIVECRYLYAFRESGCIYQPVYLGKRDDITAEECTVTQLKYKAEVQQQETKEEKAA